MDHTLFTESAHETKGLADNNGAETDVKRTSKKP